MLAVAAVIEDPLRRERKLLDISMFPPSPEPRLPTAIAAPSCRVRDCEAIAILPPLPVEPMVVLANKPVPAPKRIDFPALRSMLPACPLLEVCAVIWLLFLNAIESGLVIEMLPAASIP